MKRPLLILLLLAFSLNWMQAQTLIGEPNPILPHPVNLPPEKTMLRVKYPGTVVHDKGTSNCTDKNTYVDGRSVGSNSFNFFLRANGNLAALQYFPDFKGKITGLFFNGKSTTVPNNSVNLVVYSVDQFGSPQTDLTNTSTTIGTTQGEWGSMFTAPITINGGFFAGVEYNVQTSDTIFVETNNDGNASNDNYAIYRDGFGNFNSILFDLNVDVDFLIRPVLEFETEAFITADETTLCPDESVEFTNISSLSSFITSSYFNQFTGNVFEWDFGDGSPKVNQTNVSHTYSGDPGEYVTRMTTLFQGWTTNCFATDSAVIELEAKPEAFFAYQSNKLNVTFFNKSKFANKYDWQLGDAGSTSILENPIYTYPKSGSYAVTLLADGKCGQGSHATFIEVSDTMDFNTTSIVEIDRDLSVSLYPNPAKDKIYLAFDNLTKEGAAEMTVYNTVGEKIYQDQLNLRSGMSYELDVAAYPIGTYFVRVQIGEEQFAKTFFKH